MSDQDELIDYLISAGEAVEYGEPWTETTTHEWWRDSTGQRHVRLVMTYHGGGSRGDDDEAEYVRRLLNMGRAVSADLVHKHTASGSSDPMELRQITHVIENGKARRIRHYVAPPEES